MASVIYKQAQVSVKYLRKLMGGKLFDNPKDHEVLGRLISYCIGGDTNGTILDFFAGSASTAEAVLNLNRQDNGKRRSISVQLPEPCDEESTAFEANFTTIAAIGRERIRKVIVGIRNTSDLANSVPDSFGLRSFCLAPSSFKQWRGDGIDTIEQLAEQMQMFVRSEKDGAKTEDLLYELLLRFGQELTTPVETLEIAGQRIFTINDRKMLFILDSFVEPMIDPLLEINPREIIALDSVFADSDELKTNLDLQCRDAGIKCTCV